MSITKLSPEDRETMDGQPEVAMNIQIVKRGKEYALVVAGRIAITYDDAIISELNRLNEILRTPLDGSTDNYGERLERWTENLETSRSVTAIPFDEAFTVLGFIHFGPRFPLPGTPWRPSYIYGHLPFHGLASGNDIFYRYEAYPTSRRIDRSTNSVIKANTYASPERDAAYVNSGLGAVARYALPQLLPARWRYELKPPAGMAIHYGASVPLYGQSGGGVEVAFPSVFKNNGPIPPPHVLPIM
jgi:hypothetical protein